MDLVAQIPGGVRHREAQRLPWMNGQHIRLLPEEEQIGHGGAVLVKEGPQAGGA